VTTLTLDGEPIEFEERDMLAEELAEFARCVRGQAEPETGAAQGLAALGAVLSALAWEAEAVR
jgi:predicted dehydrogenase